MARLLLDENLPRSTSVALVRAGHDVALVAESCPGADDRRVLALAREQGRVLITLDADFAELVFRYGETAPPAIVYLRLHPIDGSAAGRMVLDAFRAPVLGMLVVCSVGGTRRRALPGADPGNR
jgi:predicted nuclease of predicted toxin-antitoxin system